MSPRPDERPHFTVYVDDDLATQVRAIAERDERPVTWVIRQAIKAHVANFGQKEAA